MMRVHNAVCVLCEGMDHAAVVFVKFYLENALQDCITKSYSAMTSALVLHFKANICKRVPLKSSSGAQHAYTRGLAPSSGL